MFKVVQAQAETFMWRDRPSCQANERAWPMRLRTKIMALLAVPVILLIALVGVAFRAERSTTQSLGLVEHSYQVKEVLGLVFDDLVSAETGMRGYLLTGKEEFLTPYTDGTAALRNDYARLTYLDQGRSRTRSGG